MDITGKLKVIGTVQQVSEKFKKIDFVLTDDSTQYAQHISFQLTQDKVDLINKYKVGDEIKVHFNLRGRGWTNPEGVEKFFNSLEAWRLEGINVSNNNNASDAGNNNNDFLTKKDDEGDLPF